MNTPLSYENTVAMEKRMPNSVFKVFVPNDKQFDAVVNAKKADQTWVTLPVDDGTTNCVNSVGMALDAGSVPIQEPNMRPDWPVTPGQLDSRLRDLMNGSNSQAWSVQQAPVDVLGTPFFQAPASFWSTLLSMLPF